MESLRSGQACLLEPDPALLGEAERIAEALRLRGLDAPAEQAIAVHLDSLEHSRVRSVGCERLALHALDQLGLQDALRAQGVSARDAAVAAALVVARMVHPSSEHAAHAWLAGSSATLELLGLERAKPLSLSKLYRTSDLLWKHREALETALAQRERSLFDTPEAIVFYDLTNVHYHGRPAGDMQFGRSKQKRSDCPLATLALALDGAGFPRCSEVLKGNVSEPGTLQAATRSSGWKRSGRPARSRRWSWTRACRQRRTWPGCAPAAIPGSRCSAPGQRAGRGVRHAGRPSGAGLAGRQRGGRDAPAGVEPAAPAEGRGDRGTAAGTLRGGGPGAARGAGPQGLHEALRQGAGTAGTAQGTLPAGGGAV